MSSRTQIARLRVTEYGGVNRTVAECASASTYGRAEIRHAVSQTARRLQRELGLSGPPLRLRGDGIVATDVAGLVRVLPNLELEIAPKFANLEAGRWRDDFFLLATLSKHGRVLPRERIGSSVGQRGDLATLVARTLANMVDANRRRLLRLYQTKTWTDVGVDGEVDEEDMMLPDPNGFRQTGLVLDRDNPFNQRILAAAEVLSLEVRELDTRRQLTRVRELLRPQSPRQRRAAAQFPSRHRHWKPVVELAEQVLEGLGTGYAARPTGWSPGFVMKTAKLWEDVVYRGLRLGLSPLRVREQRSFPLGHRANGATLEPTPDVAVRLADGRWALADAKYKGRVGETIKQISATDVYESLAFMEAAGTDRIVLLYPDDEHPGSVGTWRVFDEVFVGERRVSGVKVGVDGVSGPGGLKTIGRAMAEAFWHTRGETAPTRQSA